MGTKDKSQKSTLTYKVLIISLFILLTASGYYLNKQNVNLDKVNKSIEHINERVEEQESLINQQEDKIKRLMDENAQLKKSLEEQQGDHQEVIKQKDEIIEGLEKDLLAKAEAKKRQERIQQAKTVAYTMPSRGESKQVREVYFEATGYTANCIGCSGITATGVNLNKNRDAKIVAVDPRVVPLGTKVWVEGYGYAIAGDTGGAIKGHKLDLHFATNSQAIDWGRRTVRVKIFQG